MKYLVLFSVLIFNQLNGQHRPFPALEKLYEKGSYEKCIEKSSAFLKKKKFSKELEPIKWQLLSNFKLSEISESKTSTSYLLKTLRLGARLKKKDKDDFYGNEMNAFFEQIEIKSLDLADQYETEGKKDKAEIVYKLLTEGYTGIPWDYKKAMSYIDDYEARSAIVLLTDILNRIQKEESSKNTFEKKVLIALTDANLRINQYNESYKAFEMANNLYPNDHEILKSADAIINSIVENTLRFQTDEVIANKKFVSMIGNKTGKSVFSESQNRIIDSLVLVSSLTSNDAITAKEKSKKILESNGKSKKENNLLLFKLFQVKTVNTALLSELIVEYNDVQPQNTCILSLYNFLINEELLTSASAFLKGCAISYPKGKKTIINLQDKLELSILNKVKYLGNSREALDKILLYEKALKGNPAIYKKKRELYLEKCERMLSDKNYSSLSRLLNLMKSEFPGDIGFLLLQKKLVLQDYKETYLVNYTNQEDLFTGRNTDQCNPGKVKSLTNQKFLNTLNYFRRLAGVYDSCVLDDDLNKLAQNAAFLMCVNEELNHHPPLNWKCYSETASKGAGSSNLSLGHGGTSALLGQLTDNGSLNYSCGHRRWVLNPVRSVFGFGTTETSMALCVFGKNFNDPVKEKKIIWDQLNYVAWPSADYFPESFIPQRWSFSMAANLEDAKVTVKCNGKSVPVILEIQVTGYALNTVVWEMNSDNTENNVYEITVSNIKKYVAGEDKEKILTYTYKVMPVNTN
ncbi:MAG: CAP domain-containing protein [Bacteroidia bacterium]|nr:CAP domain-containing protein [Bacteroidia bacterium]